MDVGAWKGRIPPGGENVKAVKKSKVGRGMPVHLSPKCLALVTRAQKRLESKTQLEHSRQQVIGRALMFYLENSR